VGKLKPRARVNKTGIGVCDQFYIIQRMGCDELVIVMAFYILLYGVGQLWNGFSALFPIRLIKLVDVALRLNFHNSS
jgi:hypothetical protein